VGLFAVWFNPQPCISEGIFLREDFNSLKEWKPLTFKKIKVHSTYSVEENDGETFLKAESNRSASGIIFKREFDVYRYPRLRWKWKVSNIYEKGNALTKEGDDYPIRIYVIFKYDPQRADFWTKAKYKAAKLVYGEYPPHSTINFVWSSRSYDKKYITNAYTDRAKIIPMNMGKGKVGLWQTHEVNILVHYKKAFGKGPPVTGSLAIMNDSDNTGESSVSYIDFIEISE